MIAAECRHCGSENIRRNGRTSAGCQKIHCRNCNFYSASDIKTEEREFRLKTAGNLQMERVSQRGIARTLRMSRTAIRKNLKKVIPPISETVPVSRERPVPETDAIWSYVGKKSDQVRIWLAIEHQTRRIVGVAFGDRSAETCRNLWKSLPADYRRRAVCRTDRPESYAAVLPSERHRTSGKGSGETSHIERFNRTLRQRCLNLVRKTLSFSRDDHFHEIRIRNFTDHYNSALPGLSA